MLLGNFILTPSEARWANTHSIYKDLGKRQTPERIWVHRSWIVQHDRMSASIFITGKEHQDLPLAIILERLMESIYRWGADQRYIAIRFDREGITYVRAVFLASKWLPFRY